MPTPSPRGAADGRHENRTEVETGKCVRESEARGPKNGPSFPDGLTSIFFGVVSRPGPGLSIGDNCLMAHEDRAVRFYSYSAQQRDKRIVALRHAGWTLAQIGADVGMGKQGVSDALKRIAAGRPGRV
jgi:hypothetical protein